MECLVWPSKSVEPFAGNNPQATERQQLKGTRLYRIRFRQQQKGQPNTLTGTEKYYFQGLYPSQPTNVVDD
jgi:hypothetical protein